MKGKIMKLQVGVKVLIENKEGKFLLLERAGKMPSDGGYYWDIPGGRINEGEPLMTALRREVTEETGLTLAGEPILFMAQDIFVDKADLHVVRLTYQGFGSGDTTLSDEHQSYRWVTHEELLTENIDPYLRKALERQNERI
jgi:8-oxo-dGTP diphosphatase